MTSKPTKESAKITALWSNKNNRFLAAVAAIIIILSLVGGIWFFNSNRNTNSKPETKQNQSDQKPKQEIAKSASAKDPDGQAITKELRSVGYNMGFIFSQPLKDLGQQIPVKADSKNMYFPEPKPLRELVPSPQNPDKKNWFSFPKYNIEAPLEYATFQDLFVTKEDGTVDFRSDPGAKNNDRESPVQKKLENGVVHLAFSVMPGDEGNSYIIGHSSNYSSVKSKYNEVFKPIESKSQEGDEFFIWDAYGRKLKFRVFEAKAIREEDVAESYKNFGNRRVVTLQASILEKVNGKNLPTKRWLTRGELVLE